MSMLNANVECQCSIPMLNANVECQCWRAESCGGCVFQANKYIYIYKYIYPPLYFRLICYSKLKMQKHRVLAFRLFFLAGSGAAQEGISYCSRLPSTAQSARPNRWGGVVPPPIRCSLKCGLKLVPPKSCFRSSPDPRWCPKWCLKHP